MPGCCLTKSALLLADPCRTGCTEDVDAYSLSVYYKVDPRVMGIPLGSGRSGSEVSYRMHDCCSLIYVTD